MNEPIPIGIPLPPRTVRWGLLRPQGRGCNRKKDPVRALVRLNHAYLIIQYASRY